jgi:hypothetical protein
MKTLTITEGRGRLGYWLKKAAQGDDIGFMIDGKIVALRPVEVYSSDYALQEYGLSEHEMAVAEKKIGNNIKSARARGEITRFTGGKNDFH